jgi:hypothetical protein
LISTRPHTAAASHSGASIDLARVHAHPDRHEEQAHEQALEGLDHQLDFVPELGLGQQQAGDQGAERHRQAGSGRQSGDAEGAEQDQRHEHVGLAVAGEGLEQRMDHASPTR